LDHTPDRCVLNSKEEYSLNLPVPAGTLTVVLQEVCDTGLAGLSLEKLMLAKQHINWDARMMCFYSPRNRPDGPCWLQKTRAAFTEGWECRVLLLSRNSLSSNSSEAQLPPTTLINHCVCIISSSPQDKNLAGYHRLLWILLVNRKSVFLLF